MLWNRTKPTPAAASGKLVGLDVNASRASAVAASGGVAKTVPLCDFDDLPLTLNLETRKVGPVAARKAPHLVCSNYLSQLGVPREWRGPRAKITPEMALLATFEQVRNTIDRCTLTLPGYLTASQVAGARELAAKAKITLSTTATSALAIAAHRAEAFLAARPTEAKPDWVVPLHPNATGPGVVLIVEIDEAALSATALSIDVRETKVLASAAWPELSLKLWKDRLLDAIADRCVRLCRRDPRDSAEAEQGLFDSLDATLAKSRTGETVTLAARADRWYQDLSLSTADFESFSTAFVKQSMAHVTELISTLPLPPKAVWLSSAAAVMPGLATALHDHSHEGAEVAVLPKEAAAEAAAALDARARSGTLAGEHADTAIAAPSREAKAQLQRS